MQKPQTWVKIVLALSMLAILLLWLNGNNFETLPLERGGSAAQAHSPGLDPENDDLSRLPLPTEGGESQKPEREAESVGATLVCFAKWEGSEAPVSGVQFYLAKSDGSKTFEESGDQSGETQFHHLSHGEYYVSASTPNGEVTGFSGPLAEYHAPTFLLSDIPEEPVTLFFEPLWMAAVVFEGEEPYELRNTNPKNGAKRGGTELTRKFLQEKWGPHVAVFAPQESEAPIVERWSAFFANAGIREFDFPILPINEFSTPVVVDAHARDRDTPSAILRVTIFDASGRAIEVCGFRAVRTQAIAGLERVDVASGKDTFLPQGTYRLSLSNAVIPWAIEAIHDEVSDSRFELSPGQLEVMNFGLENDYEEVVLHLHGEDGERWDGPVAFEQEPGGRIGQYFVPGGREQFDLPLGSYSLVHWPRGEPAASFEVVKAGEVFELLIRSK